MESNIFILSDASYSNETKVAGLGVVDTFSQKTYKLTQDFIKSAYEAEFNALALSIKIAIKEGYTNVVFVYDCKSLEIDALKEYALKKIQTVQFLWLKRTYLKQSDNLAKNARKLAEKFYIKKATQEQLIEIKKKANTKSKIDKFISYSTRAKIKAILKIANKREKEILNGFISSNSINLNTKDKLGSKKATFMKFTYYVLTKEDKTSFLNYLTYVNPNLNKKSFRKAISIETVENYIMKILKEVKNTKKIIMP